MPFCFLSTHTCLLYLFGDFEGGEVERTVQTMVYILGQKQTRTYVTWKIAVFNYVRIYKPEHDELPA